MHWGVGGGVEWLKKRFQLQAKKKPQNWINYKPMKFEVKTQMLTASLHST